MRLADRLGRNRRSRSGHGEPRGAGRRWMGGSALAFVALNVTFFAWRGCSVPPTPPVFAEQMPEWSAATLDSGRLQMSEFYAGHYGVLLYAEREVDSQTARYLQVLLDRYREYGPGLRIALAIGPDHADEAALHAVARPAGYPVIHDAAGLLRRTLGLRPHSNHSFLLAPDTHVVLSASGLLGRDELRQHVEKHLMGEIQYAASPISLLGPGARLPVYDVTDARDQDLQARSYRPEPGTTVIALPAALCAACDQSRVYGRISAYVREHCVTEDECPVELLATAGFSVVELLRALDAAPAAASRALAA